jgi:hypothetical protein
MIGSILADIYREFGWKTRIIAPLLGIFVVFAIRREQLRLATGWSYEPPVFYEKNARALAQKSPEPSPDRPRRVPQGALMPQAARN